MDWWRILHTLSLIWLGAGIGAIWPPILRAWATKDVQYQMYCLREAANNETRVLVPGAMASGVTGFFWAASQNLNFFTTGWLLALWLSFIFFYLVCLPLMGWGLRRARLAALIAAKKGEVTPDLQEVLDDRVPLVFSTVLVISIPLMAWFAVFKPF
ncbi:DUF2269 family protein [bacterium]|nr:DUF2269 family protein [bacterium]